VKELEEVASQREVAANEKEKKKLEREATK